MKNRCLLVSFFNSNNLGDYLIADTLRKVAGHFFEVDICSYEGREVYNDGTIHETPYIKKRMANIIEKFCAHKKMSDTSPANLDTQLVHKIRKSNYQVLILGGGNMIMDLTDKSNGAEWFGKWVLLGKECGMKVIAMSIGVGPFSTSTQLENAKKYLSLCDYVTFRDKASKDLLMDESSYDFGEISIDPVFTIDRRFSHKLKNDDNYPVLVNLIEPTLFTADKELISKIKMGYNNLIVTLLKSNRDIILFSTEANDYPILRKIYKKNQSNKRLQLVSISNAEDMFKLYSNPAVLLGCRMHSLIIASTQRIPVIGIVWQSKVKSFFEIIDCKENCYPIENITDEIDSICNSVNSIICDYDEREKYIDIKMDSLKNKFQINYRILNEISEMN